MKVKKHVQILLIAVFFMMFNGCKITSVFFPSRADKGEVIEITLNVTDNLPEPNAHKGLLGVLLPADWELITGRYAFEHGSGILEVSEEWKDTIEATYPAAEFGVGYKWVALVSDKAYAYNDKINLEVTVSIKVSEINGCYDLGFLVTKATSGLISAKNLEWAPLSYPNRITIPSTGSCSEPFIVEEAHEWNAIFHRDSGWTGADGIYSIPFNEVESRENNSKHLLLFSDTFVGRVDSNGKRIYTTMVNNTLAVLNSNQPAEDQIEFIIKESSGRPTTMFVPNTPESKEGDWYWLMDGIKIGDWFYVYALRLEKTGDDSFGFEYIGVNLIRFKLDEKNNVVDVSQYDTPLYAYDESQGAKYLLGQALMPMSVASRNYVIDGYVYIYGPKDINNRKELICGRFLPEDILNFEKYEYWNGAEWKNDITQCAPLIDQISQEFSVSPLPNGKFLLVIQMGSSVAYRIGESPVGPFGIFNIIYDCPELEISDNIIVYNAKAHPSLSTDNKILISYNVNTTDLAENFNIADIYRPRFLYLSINDQAIPSVVTDEKTIDSFRLMQNYPNPFNPSTVIEFNINKKGTYSLKLYDTLGQEVKTLIEKIELSPGKHTYKLDAGNLSSGVYLYKLESSENLITKKLMILK